MANQYQNFTNPTIVPDQPMGWQAASQGVGDVTKTIGDYFAQQNEAKQGLLLDQAKTLSGYQNMYAAYTGQRNPNIDAILMQNPFGRIFASQTGRTNPNPFQSGGIPMASPSASGGLSMGMMPSMAPTSMGGQGSSQGSGDSSGPVVTGSSSTFAPFGPMGPKMTTESQSPSGEQTIAQAKATGAANVSVPEAYAKDMATKKAASVESVVRDKSNLGMLQGAYDSLMAKYDQASKEGFAGNSYDAWRGKSIANGNPLASLAPGLSHPFEFGAPHGVAGVAGFQAIRNEVMTKMQPLMSQQFGQEGSIRIMESLLKLANQEVGDLNNPRDVVAAKAQATLENFNRIAASGINYAKTLGLTPNDLSKMNPDQVNQIANTIWKGGTPASLSVPGSQFNPGGQFQAPSQNTPSQSKQLDADTAKQILQQAGGDKNKARQMAQQMGYAF